jgi:hypothetical protein
MAGKFVDAEECPSTVRQHNYRSGPRFLCQEPPLIYVCSKPRFASWTMHVRDICSRGLGLLSPYRIEPEKRLAVSWSYGPPERWRTLLARVAHATPRPQGGWVIGCELAMPLPLTDLEAFFQAAGSMRRY